VSKNTDEAPHSLHVNGLCLNGVEAWLVLSARKEDRARLQQEQLNTERGHAAGPPSTIDFTAPAPVYAASRVPSGTAAARRTASVKPIRVAPLIIRLTPTSSPIAQIELDGHCI
jgi:hypothetical protein